MARAGVIKSSADGKIEDTGALNTKRMETVDEEFLAAAKDFIDRQAKADKPFFCWFNSTRMHVFTHLKKESSARPARVSMPMAWSSMTVMSDSFSINSTASVSPTIRSCSTRPTTAPKSPCGRTER